MKKIWVLNYRMSDLQSVENISSSLVKLYLSLHPEFEVVVLELDKKKSFKNKLDECLVSPPDVIAVVHPSVNYHPFFLSLLTICPKCSYLIHVFGNFFRNAELWCKQAHLYQKKNVQFIAASESYQKVLSGMIPSENLSVIPFPVQQASFSEPQSHEGIRLLYTGRYHEQKNVTALIEVLAQLKLPVELTLVCAFDDFNPTTFQTQKIQGEQFQKLLAVKSQMKINVLTHLSFETLASEFSNHDAFISFSTFFDEDYGCSVMEALCAGLPCLVSRWGGYGDFARAFPQGCFALDVKLEQNEFVLETDSLSETLARISAMTIVERRQLAENAKYFVSNERLGVLLKNLLNQKKIFNDFQNVDNFEKYYSPFWLFEENKK